jgi:DNA repair exonuclease SbcCD ATPase subunit
MKIEIQSVTVRNFLSYGNVPQIFEFKKGINVITGIDKNTGRSNGVGKTNILQSIPFAFFGKTGRDIKKDNIINWKNKKNCEVSCTFKKGDNTYTIKRGIKKDYLEIYKNDVLIPIPSDIRTYQKQLENDIINIDYNTFMYLFYTNLNTNVPLLKMSVPQKRSFLEKMFNLDTFSNLSNNVNTKLKSITETIFTLDTSINSDETTIKDLTEQNTSIQLKIVDLNPLYIEIQSNQTTYDLKKSECVDIPSDISEKIKKITLEIETNEKKLNEYKNSMVVHRNNVKSLEKNIKKLKEQEDNNTNVLNDLKSQLLELCKDGYVGHLSFIDNKLIELKLDIEQNGNSVSQLTIDRNKEKTNLAVLQEKLITLKENYELFKNGICPTCNRKMTEKLLKDNYLDTISGIESEIKQTHDNIKQYDDNLTIFNNSRVGYDKKVIELKDERQKIMNIVDKIIVFDNMSTISYTEEENSILENNKQIEDTLKLYDSLVKDNDLLVIQKDDYLTKERDIIELNNLIDKIKHLQNEYDLKLSNKNDLSNIITSNNEKIKTLTKKVLGNKKRKFNLNELYDYITYIKNICKDENVKQFAITSYMPYLTKQTNSYLSKAGSSHYIKFNKWIEEEIHGPGVFNATYENLSGGEARSIDLAIQFSFLDISRIKTGIFPDILMLDEILDSSIDSNGLSNILKIIKNKQLEDDNKILIITHRTDLTDFVADNIYNIVKTDGFSRIEKL